jgi:zinc protease
MICQIPGWRFSPEDRFTSRGEMTDEFTRVTLDNGLLVLLKETHTASIISHWLWYRVGSRDESPGITGASHWVEHMMFKGTPKFPSRWLDKAIARAGGYWNAMTYIDWTTYFATIPAGEIDLILRLEADRMMNTVFEPGEVASERTVIISERQGHENSPIFRLNEEVQGAAFQVHTYHHEVIGNMIDLESINRDALFEHYKRHYLPNNAILSIVGDFDTNVILSQVREVFEPIPAGAEPPRQMQAEPVQQEERQVTVEGPGETAFVRLAYRAPRAVNEDFFILLVLDSLLTGPSSLNMFGGGISNKTSKLYRALVDKEFAVNVSGGVHATIDPYLYNIAATVHPKRRPEDVIAEMDAQIEKAWESQPSVEELARAVKQARAMFAYGSESITNQAFWMGFAEVFDRYEWFLSYLSKLAAVTPADVQRVAQEYLQPHNRVAGMYLPAGNGGGSA